MRLTEKVRKGIFAKLNVSGVTDLAPGGVHNDIAPEGTAYPFVTFSAVVPGIPKHTFGTSQFNLTINSEESFWFIWVWVDKNSSTTKEPQALAEEILEACDTALGNSLTLAGGSETEAVYRTEDLPNLEETLVDRTVWKHGFKLRVVAKL